MQQTPRLTSTFHARIIGVTMFLSLLDTAFVYVAVQSVLKDGPSMQLLFGFEVLHLDPCAVPHLTR